MTRRTYKRKANLLIERYWHDEYKVESMVVKTGLFTKKDVFVIHRRYTETHFIAGPDVWDESPEPIKKFDGWSEDFPQTTGFLNVVFVPEEAQQWAGTIEIIN